jgi:hypothetical protein
LAAQYTKTDLDLSHGNNIHISVIESNSVKIRGFGVHTPSLCVVW